ncbi:dinitrogenase iron-molybdenum cofactor biosynthesis protein [Candidatus Fermentibacteria bacterium]|nr:MAG: dinitrogenase iron-molybdenum cofactor biosynthesis protein [Candidatus Fermentibacteria bacterium]PIE52828.1 MAG: dinitrogenase iron-molybdenum cofactor biosynthesis protein [Candidatus Fermentibacteria bacterium]
MKIAVASSGREMSAPLDSRFGRAEAFVVYDTDSETFEAVNNQMNLNAAQGAGIQAAQNAAATGAGAIIAANIGPKAAKVLQTAGVKMYLCQAGTVREALEQYKSGKLTEADGANTEGHW